MNHPLLALLAACLILPATAADWPNWRGPNFNGSTEAKGLPSTFSPTENVRWKALLPGPAGSSPLVVGGLVYLTAAVEKDNQVVALALDAKTGAVKWGETLVDVIATATGNTVTFVGGVNVANYYKYWILYNL